jgi:GT2 family glycosyltransferase
MKFPYIIIPNWNGADLLRKCLTGLQEQSLAHHVIVVENGSTDDSATIVKTEFPEIQLLEFNDNAGFAGGVNRGIRVALAQGAEYIALLNNDAVADKHWLSELVKAAEVEPKAGMVAAKIVTQDGKRIDSTGDFYSTWGFPFPRGRGELDGGQYDGPNQRNVFAASGGASLYRADMFAEVGLFDERFFAYFEDVDISFRARLAGWKIVYQPTARVRHFIGGTSSRMNQAGTKMGDLATEAGDGHARPSAFARFHTVKNFYYLYTKNMPTRLYWKYLPLLWASAAMMIISDTKRGLLGSNLRAHFTVAGEFAGILATRREIQHKRRVSVAEIDAQLIHELPPLQRIRFERLGLARRKS